MTNLTDFSIPSSKVSSVLWRHRLLISLMIVHLAAGLMISLMLNIPFQSGTFGIMQTQVTILIPVYLVILLFWRFGWMAIVKRPDKPIRFFITDMKANLIDCDRVVSGVVAFLCIALFVGTFAFIKDVLPHMVPYSWDPTFAAWDRALHFGHDPWVLLLPLFGSPVMTSAINVAYHFWFFLMYFLVFCACFDIRNSKRAAVFLVSFMLCWILGGNVAATLLSSVGPVFYEAVGFGDTFVPLMDRLYEINEITRVWAIDIQELLLDGYLNDGPIKGISAMPSMHVGSTVIMTLYCFTLKRWLGWLMVGFTTIIMIGSVHLAWHYAIDSYLAVLIALGCWWLGKRLVGRFAPEP